MQGVEPARRNRRHGNSRFHRCDARGGRRPRLLLRDLPHPALHQSRSLQTRHRNRRHRGIRRPLERPSGATTAHVARRRHPRRFSHADVPKMRREDEAAARERSRVVVVVRSMPSRSTDATRRSRALRSSERGPARPCAPPLSPRDTTARRRPPRLASAAAPGSCRHFTAAASSGARPIPRRSPRKILRTAWRPWVRRFRRLDDCARRSFVFRRCDGARSCPPTARFFAPTFCCDTCHPRATGEPLAVLACPFRSDRDERFPHHAAAA